MTIGDYAPILDSKGRIHRQLAGSNRILLGNRDAKGYFQEVANRQYIVWASFVNITSLICN